jgi:hypothetical protein
MSVPGASGLTGGLSDQFTGETEDQRRKRLLAQQQAKVLPQPGASSLLPAAGAGYGVAFS